MRRLSNVALRLGFKRQEQARLNRFVTRLRMGVDRGGSALGIKAEELAAIAQAESHIFFAFSSGARAKQVVGRVISRRVLAQDLTAERWLRLLLLVQVLVHEHEVDISRDFLHR